MQDSSRFPPWLAGLAIGNGGSLFAWVAFGYQFADVVADAFAAGPASQRHVNTLRACVFSTSPSPHCCASPLCPLRVPSAAQRTACALLRRRTHMADSLAAFRSANQNLAGCHLRRCRTITHHNLLSEGATAMIGVPQLCGTQILGVFLRLAPHP